MINIEDYGWNPSAMPGAESGIPARITAVRRERYEAVCLHGIINCVLKSGAYRAGNNEAFPTVGDFVSLEYNPNGDSRITKTMPRKSYFSRSDNSGHAEGYVKTLREQAVAANFDYVFILSSLNGDFNIGRIERYLTLAWQSGGIPVVALTKADLAEDFEKRVRIIGSIAAGVRVIAVSAVSGQGISEIRDMLTSAKTAVFLGSSGVGKSSLVNALTGEAVMDVKEIRENDGRGRHTTTHRQLIVLPSGGMVIDTPGMRELGMWSVSIGLDAAFSDVEEILSRGCKFSDCRHVTEPRCAIREALKSGELSYDRWQSYQKLKAEAEFADNKAAALNQKRKRNKEISIYAKRLKAHDYVAEPCAESFICKVCGTQVLPEGAGSGHRNHCPKCLSSVHLDNKPGDRASHCGGIMDAIGVWVRKNGEWAIIHRCRACGELSSNRTAADDNPVLLMSIAVKPLAAPPFPLGILERNLSGENLTDGL